MEKIGDGHRWGKLYLQCMASLMEKMISTNWSWEIFIFQTNVYSIARQGVFNYTQDQTNGLKWFKHL